MYSINIQIEKIMSKKNIIICTARYSDNLGDGVISDCVEFLIKSLNSESEVVHLDIAGRTKYHTSVQTKSSLTKSVFHATPNALKPLLTYTGWQFKFKNKIEQRIQEIDFSKADRLIFGGGQLISDVGLNFPLKLSYICSQAEKNDLNFSFNSVGVANQFSTKGKKLINNIFASKNMKMISVRDTDSKLHLESLGVNQHNILNAVDTGLWAGDAYKMAKTHESKLIGIGISNPKELQTHSENYDSSGSLKFWVDLISSYTRTDYIPVLFTNGSSDDNSFFYEVLKSLELSGVKGYRVEALPLVPNELVRIISQFCSIISHRLHANIVAHSMYIPSLALSWDKKVQSYCDLIGRSDWCMSDSQGVGNVIERHQKIMQQGIDVSIIEELKKTAKVYLNKQLEY